MAAAAIVAMIAMLSIGYAGCVSSEKRGARGEGETEGAEVRTRSETTKDYLYVEITFPTQLRSYMRVVRDALVRRTTHLVSSIRARTDETWVMDVRVDIQRVHRQYPFITYMIENDVTKIRATLTAANIATLLSAPPGSLLPPAEANLSRAEIVEFYRWQLSSAVPTEQIEGTLAATSIALIIEPRSESLIGGQRARRPLLELLHSRQALTVQAHYR